MTRFHWPTCPECGCSSSVMNDYVTQRLDLARRVQFKFQLAQCYICADVYHREREFLLFAAQELYPTHYAPPVTSDERLCLGDFVSFFQPGDGAEAVISYKSCFDCPEHAEARIEPLPYLSDFSVAALSLVTSQRLLSSLGGLPADQRATVLLYLMGIRSYEHLARETGAEADVVKELLFRGRRKLQHLVCSS